MFEFLIKSHFWYWLRIILVFWHCWESAGYNYCRRRRLLHICSNVFQLAVQLFIHFIWHFNVKCFDQKTNNNNMFMYRVWIGSSLTWTEVILKILTLNIAMSSTENNKLYRNLMASAVTNRIRFFFVSTCFRIKFIHNHQFVACLLSIHHFS